MDPNYENLAAVLTGHSTQLQAGERVLIDAFDIPDAMVIALIRAVRERGAVPFVNVQRASISRELVDHMVPQQFEAKAGWELAQMQQMDAYIAVRGSDNIYERTSGNHTITRQGGSSLNLTVVEPLIKKYACNHVSQGQLDLQGSVLDGILDYGNNVCDNQATYTHSNGNVYPVILY